MSISDLDFERLLNEDPNQKRVTMLCRSQQDPSVQAIVTLSRRQFQLDGLLAGVKLDESQLQNDVYSKYTGSLPDEHNAITVDIIKPATEKHIQKYSAQETVLVRETPAMYSSITQPYIRSFPLSRLQWVYNILDKKAEAERLVYEDPHPELGFMLHPDLKWDQVQLEQMYCIALCHRRDISSLRDLTEQHLPLLHNMRSKALQAIEQRYGIAADKIRVFVHYQPSYYHFHVHFVHIKYEGSGLVAGKAHLLDDIIDNITTFGGDFYQRRTLAFTCATNDELCKLLTA